MTNVVSIRENEIPRHLSQIELTICLPASSNALSCVDTFTYVEGLCLQADQDRHDLNPDNITETVHIYQSISEIACEKVGLKIVRYKYFMQI